MYLEAKSRMRTMAKRLLSLICAFALAFSSIPVSVWAEELDEPPQTEPSVYQVEVTVTDDKNTPIANAEVNVSKDEVDVFSGVTNTVGKVIYTEADAGTYEIRAAVTGYVEKNTSVTVTDQNETAELKLSKQKFAISAVNVVGGHVTPSAAEVEYNENVSFTVESDEGYQLVSVLVNEENVTAQLDAASSYTIENVTEAKSIKATFEKKKYEITTIVDANGKLSKKEANQAGQVYAVEHGDSFEYVVEANAGYRIEKVLVDNVPVAGTFDNSTEKYEGVLSAVDKAHTIEASFTKKEYQVEIRFEKSKNDTYLNVVNKKEGDKELQHQDKVVNVYGQSVDLGVQVKKGYTAQVTADDSKVQITKTGENAGEEYTNYEYQATGISEDTFLTVVVMPVVYTVEGWNPLGQKEMWTYTVEDTKELTLTEPDAQKGYAFVGWVKAEDGAVSAESERLEKIALTECSDMEVYAVWNVAKADVTAELTGTKSTNAAKETWFNSAVKVTLNTKAKQLSWSYTTDEEGSVAEKLENNSLDIDAALTTVKRVYRFTAEQNGTINGVSYTYVTDGAVEVQVLQDGQKPDVTIKQSAISWNNLENHQATDRLVPVGKNDEYEISDNDNSGSGVKLREYQYVEFRKVKDFKEQELIKYLNQQKWTAFTGNQLSITPATEGEWVLIVRETDYANNESYVDSSGVLFDQTAPNVKVELTYRKADKEASIVDSVADIYSQDTITATVTVTDAMLVFSNRTEYQRYSVKLGDDVLEAKNPKLTYNKDKGLYVWTADFDIAKADYKDKDGKKLTVLAADESNNVPEKGEKQYTSGNLYIDTIRPVISIDYQEYSSKTETTVYDNDKVTMTVKIEDDHMERTDVVIVRAGDGNTSEKLDLTKASVCSYEKDGNQHIFTISVEKNSVYTVNAADLAGNAAKEAKSLELKFDKTYPVITIEYSYGIQNSDLQVQSLTDTVVIDPDNDKHEYENFNGDEERLKNYSFSGIVANIKVTDSSGLNSANDFAANSAVVLKGASGELSTNSVSVEIDNAEKNKGLNKEGTEWTGNVEIAQEQFENKGDVQLQIRVKDSYGNETVHNSHLLAVDTEAADITSAELEIGNNNPVAKAINFLTFGVFFNKTATLTIDYEDEIELKQENEEIKFDGSGVVQVRAIVNDETVDEKQLEAAEVDGQTKLTVPVEWIGEVLDGNMSLTTTDLVGNMLTPEELSVKSQAANSSYVMYEVDSPIIEDDHTEESVSYHDKKTDSYWVLAGNAVTITAKDNSSGLNQVMVQDNGKGVAADRSSEDNAEAEAVEAVAVLAEAVDDETADDETAGDETVDENAEPGYLYRYGNLDKMTKDMAYTVAYDDLGSDMSNVFVVNAVDNSNNGNKQDGQQTKIKEDDAGDPEDYTFTVYKDTSLPVLDSIQLTGDGWMDQYNSLDFGSFFNKSVTVNAKVHDGDEQISSGTAETVLTYAEAEKKMKLDFTDANTEGSTSANAQVLLALGADQKVVESALSISQKDNVGNSSTNPLFDEDNKRTTDTNLKVNSLMIETVAPVKNGNETVSKPTYTEKDGSKWYPSTDIRYSVPVSDVDSGIRKVEVTLNDQQVHVPELVWEYYQLSRKTTELDVDFNLAELVNDAGETVVVEGENTLSILVTDNAGNSATVFEDTLYIDMTAPVITGYQFNLANYQDNADENGIANVVVSTKYGFYFKKDVKVTVLAVDNALSAGIKAVVYKAVDKNTGKTVVSGTAERFDAVLGEDTGICSANVSGSTSVRYTFTIPASFKGQIYAYAVDHVGNYPVEENQAGEELLDEKGKPVPLFVSPDKTVVENLDMHKRTSSITFDKAETPYRTADGQELYAGNVNVTMNVEDLYSGIRKVEWSLTSPEDKGNNQSGVVEIDNAGKFSGDSGWNNGRKQKDENIVTKISKTIQVKNNSNSIVLSVRLTDRAGNVLPETKITFSIDKTKPVIDVKYDNNTPDGAYKEYYNKDRTATITITERNFDDKDVVLKLTNNLGRTPSLSKWTKHSAANGYDSDKDTYTAKLTFHEDGDYKFDLAFSDRADNKAASFSDEFTIDETKPAMKAVLRKADGAEINGNDEYSSSAVEITITIVEHNFDTGRVKCTMKQDEANFTWPLKWSGSGDTHTATIPLAGDAHYTFDLASSDMAGNPAEPFATRTVYVDESDPVITLKDIKKANGGRDENKKKIDVFPVIEVNDKYFNNGGVTFELTRANGEAIATADAARESYLQEENGEETSAEQGKYRFANLEVDDLYTLKVSATDLSGRTQTKMMLGESVEDSDAEQLNEDGGVESYTFSVNRDGTVYVYSDDLREIIGADNLYYQPGVIQEKNLFISAYDVEPLEGAETKLEILKDGAQINTMKTEIDRQGRINEQGKYSQWYQYDYILAKEDFAQDGRYDVKLSDVDRLGNTRSNDADPIMFFVDGTAPSVVVRGMEKERVYADSLLVEYSISDTFTLKSLDVTSKTDREDTPTTLHSVAEFDGAEYQDSFVIPEKNHPQEIKWVIYDKAGNCYDSSKRLEGEQQLFQSTVLVSKDVVAQWYYNTPLFVGTLVTLGSAVGVGLTLFAVKRRKKDTQEENKV